MPFPSPGYLPNPGIDWSLLHWQANSLPLKHQGSPCPIAKVNEKLQRAKQGGGPDDYGAGPLEIDDSGNCTR